MKPIALDIDGVIASTYNAMRQRVLQQFSLSEAELVDSGDYNNMYSFEDKKLHGEVNDYISKLFQEDTMVYFKADPVPGAIEGSLIVQPSAYITRRPAKHGIDVVTAQWLKKWGFYPAPLYFIPRGTCKSGKMKELGIEVIVEDSPGEIRSCRSNGVKTLIMKQIYNAEFHDDPDVVAGWDDLIQRF